MFISDISVKRPVFALVVNLLLIVFGIVAFSRLPLREYPDVDAPIISISTTYLGAAAEVVQTRITQPIEDRIAGVQGVKNISSDSQDGVSKITVEFDIKRNIDDAANDIRDRVSGVLKDLPQEADAPEVQKSDSNDDVILWLTLSSTDMNVMQLTDYARRYIEDGFSAIDGVARVRIGGEQDMALRIWLDRDALAARGLATNDVEHTLASENVELPAGSIESQAEDFTVHVQRSYKTPADFRKLVLGRGKDGYLVRLGDVARIELGPAESRALLRGNGVSMVGIGIIKQSKSNTLSVARLAKTQMERVNKTLPHNMKMEVGYDTSVFVESAVKEVYKTLFIAVGLVVLVIYAFLGNVRAMLVPALTIPVSLIGAFLILYITGFTINLLTLLALILAIGLVVDDAIVVIENIHRRIEMGEPRVVAAFRGTRQVGFAVIATTVVLVSVFVPITFLEGDVGRLFTEFAVTMSGAVLLSAFTALTFSPMLSSKILDRTGQHNRFTHWLDHHFERLKTSYITRLGGWLDRPAKAITILLLMMLASFFFIKHIPSEFTPKEDRGAFFLMLRGPEGASYDYILEHAAKIEQRLMPLVKSGDFQYVMVRAPGSFGASSSFNDAIIVVVLSPWNKRKLPIWAYIGKVMGMVSDIPGVAIFPIVRQGVGGFTQKPVQFVIGGPTYEDLAKWRDIILEKARDNPKLIGLDSDYKETEPQIGIVVNQDRAGDLGVPVSAISNTLETMLGSRRVTTFTDRGEEYDVILESAKPLKRTPEDIANIYVRSDRTNQLIPLSNLVSLHEFADAASLKRYNRLRSITLDANLAEGYTQGDALTYLENLVHTNLPPEAHIDYKGESMKYKESGSSIYFIFLLSLIVVFLVLAGQFESFIHPFVIILTVPLAITGALFALWLTGQTLNIYSQIALIILIGIAAKNGILIVEFTNQLRDQGIAFRDAILDASGKRLRPIIMTSVTTAAGALPLILSSGAGSETRLVIGIVVFTGVIIATFLTLFIVPSMYALLAKNTTSPEAVARRLEGLLKEHEAKI